MAAAGFPLPLLTDVVSEAAADYLLKILEGGEVEKVVEHVLSQLGDRLENALREGLKDLIRGAFRVLIGIVDPFGAIAHKVCQLLGFCP